MMESIIEGTEAYAPYKKEAPQSGVASAEDVSAGLLVYVIGPSGAGKDSLIRYAQARMAADNASVRPDTSPVGKQKHYQGDASAKDGRTARPVRFMERFITRPKDSGGELHRPVSYKEFELMKRAGFFCMDWQSHGLCYGIGVELNALLAQGALVVVNGSRAYLPVAEVLYPNLQPMLVTVKPSVLRSRLEQRGRETPEQIEERLAHALLPVLSKHPVPAIDNSGDLHDAEESFANMLSTLRLL